MEKITCTSDVSANRQLALNDALELLTEKWKIVLLRRLYLDGIMRFKDLLQSVQGISPKILSKELQQLEGNLLVTRTVNNTKPITVSYKLTNHAKEILPVINALIEFGLKHRTKIRQSLVSL